MRPRRPHAPSIDTIAEHLTKEGGVLEVITRKEGPFGGTRFCVCPFSGGRLCMLLWAGAWDLSALPSDWQ